MGCSRVTNSDLQQAAELLQAALRGHQVRKRKMSGLRRDISYDDDTTTESDVISNTSHRELHRQRRSLDSDRDVDHAVMTLQSVFRGHMARKKQMTQRRSPSGFSNGRTRQESIGDRYSTPSTSRRSLLKRSKTPPEEEDSEEESEDSDEICVGSR
ncbi:hypothetical protein LSAT2_015938 [Lamellibrachia satsuma]|nr:hypothetical protein LSAT2_015938 [Lamellibrachia satsuma]